ncbi:MAG: hypothetical protein K5917_02645 [Clostridiales bacterium]|nr:hypothetical protein [Clostridiales bacterium]
MLKSTGLSFFVPLIMVDAVLPLILYFDVKKFGLKQGFEFSLAFFMLCIPFMSVWWLILSLRDFVESDGCEIVYVNQDKNKLLDSIAIFLIYIVDVLILFLVIRHWYPPTVYPIFPQMYKIMLTSVFYFGVTYFVMFVVRNTTAALMVSILYTIVNVVICSFKSKIIPFLYYYTDGGIMTFYLTYVPLAALGVALVFLACIINSKRRKV